MHIDFVGCGGLNLDHIYEISSYDALKELGMSLTPGREFKISRDDAVRIKEKLANTATLKYMSGGGSSANTITILSHLGWKTAFLGICGDDNEGDIVLSSMKGVDVSLVKRIGKSAMCIILLDSHRDRCILLVPHSLEADFVDENSLELLSQSRCLHVTSLVHETGFKNQLNLVKNLKSNQLLSFDPGEIYCQKGLEYLMPILARTNILFITSRELTMLLESRACKKNIDNIIFLYNLINENSNYYYKDFQYPRLIVCKMGSEGAILYDGKDFINEAAFKIQVVDNTGAGDAFNAGFLSGIFRGLSLAESLKEAIYLATESLKDYGRSWLKNANKQ